MANANRITLTEPTFTGALTLPAALRPTVVALTDAATIAVDATLGNYFRCTLGGNRTLGNPTGAVDGQVLTYELLQDATGARVLTLGSSYRLGTDIAAVVLTVTANAHDFLTVRFNGVNSLFYVVGFVRGYANV
jgi:hypothetical protein